MSFQKKNLNKMKARESQLKRYVLPSQMKNSTIEIRPKCSKEKPDCEPTGSEIVKLRMKVESWRRVGVGGALEKLKIN